MENIYKTTSLTTTLQQEILGNASGKNHSNCRPVCTKSNNPLASKQGFLPQKPFPPLFIMVTFTLTSSSPRSWEIVAIISL